MQASHPNNLGTLLLAAVTSSRQGGTPNAQGAHTPQRVELMSAAQL